MSRDERAFVCYLCSSLNPEALTLIMYPKLEVFVFVCCACACVSVRACACEDGRGARRDKERRVAWEEKERRVAWEDETPTCRRHHSTADVAKRLRTLSVSRSLSLSLSRSACVYTCLQPNNAPPCPLLSQAFDGIDSQQPVTNSTGGLPLSIQVPS